MESQYITLVEDLCNQASVDPVVIRSIISVESNWVHGKTRYEPNWRYFYRPHVYANKLGITIGTETVGQMHSYSLMQVMGAVMRERGFIDYWIEVTPEINVKIGIEHFKSFLDKHQSLDKAISCYNAGQLVYVNGKFKNQVYVDKVMTKIEEIKNGKQKSVSV